MINSSKGLHRVQGCGLRVWDLNSVKGVYLRDYIGEYYRSY